jgi:hypothetical protein
MGLLPKQMIANSFVAGEAEQDVLSVLNDCADWPPISGPGTAF